MKNLFLVLLLLATGCSAATQSKIDTFVDHLHEVTVKDVSNALAHATAQGDTQAMFCWSTLKTHLESGALKRSDDELLASAIQRLRAESRGQGPITQIKEACSPVVDSVATTAIATAVKLGLVAAPIPGVK